MNLLFLDAEMIEHEMPYSVSLIIALKKDHHKSKNDRMGNEMMRRLTCDRETMDINGPVLTLATPVFIHILFKN